MAEVTQISVAVLDGYFHELKQVGLPFSVCYDLQDSKLTLETALWTAKKTHCGYSVSLFWPTSKSTKCDEVGGVNKAMKPSKKRRRKMRKPQINSYSKVEDKPNPEPEKEVESTPTPVSAHHCDDRRLTSPPVPVLTSQASHFSAQLNSCEEEPPQQQAVKVPQDTDTVSTEKGNRAKRLDLATCKKVEFEKRAGVPGVSYIDKSTNLQEWTPVKKRKMRSSRARLPSSCSSGGESSDSDLDLSRTTNVYYHEKDGTPGIIRNYRRARGRWTPVVPSPIASRTRTKTKVDFST